MDRSQQCLLSSSTVYMRVDDDVVDVAADDDAIGIGGSSAMAVDDVAVDDAADEDAFDIAVDVADDAFDDDAFDDAADDDAFDAACFFAMAVNGWQWQCHTHML